MSIQPTGAVNGRPVTLFREGPIFRLAFDYAKPLVERASKLPSATFDKQTRSWTTPVCAQSVNTLRGWFYEGLTDVGVDSLLTEGETPPTLADAVLTTFSKRRPYAVKLLTREDALFTRFRAVFGARYDKRTKSLTYPATAAAALADLADRGVLADPEKLLAPAEVTVLYDARVGTFTARGNAQAAAAFGKHFPVSDIVASWQAKGLDADFLDTFTAQMYAGEIARNGAGVQPAGLVLPLLDFQAVCVGVALQRDGFAIFSPPGVGKTPIAIGTGFELLNRGAISRVVVVVPAAIRTQWRGEIERFTGADAGSVVVVRGRTPAARQAAYDAALDAQWFVVHYDVLAKDEKLLKPLFDGALVIADEAHRVKNYQARRTQALLNLCTGAARRLALTGTPIESNPSEWYAVLSEFAVPGVLGSVEEYNDRYRFKNPWGGHEGARNLPELRIRSKPLYIRHTKAEVAKHLPPLRVQHVPLDPDPVYAAALRRAHTEAVKEITAARLDQAAKRAGQVTLLDETLADEAKAGAEMTATGMLRLMCSSPRLVANSDAAAAQVLRDAGLVPDEDGPKLDELRVITAELRAAQLRRKEEMVEAGLTEATPDMVTGERVVVFTFSAKMVDLICERLTEDGVPHVSFTGSTSPDDRDAAVAAFTDPNSDVVAFVATDAAAEGLNLGRCCSTLIQFDLPWTPSRGVQRMNRIHRIDGTAPAYHVLNFTVAGTLEAGVLRLLENRADMADALLGEAGSRYAATGRGVRRQTGNSRSVVEEVLSSYDAGAATRRAASAARKAASRPEPKPAGAEQAQLAFGFDAASDDDAA